MTPSEVILNSINNKRKAENLDPICQDEFSRHWAKMMDETNSILKKEPRDVGYILKVDFVGKNWMRMYPLE